MIDETIIFHNSLHAKSPYNSNINYSKNFGQKLDYSFKRGIDFCCSPPAAS
jgi:hypothetical protein